MIPMTGELHAVKVEVPNGRRWSYPLLVSAFFTALVTAVVVLVRSEGVPPIKLLLLFAALVIIAENRDRIFGDETSISGSIAVAVGSVIAFRHSTPLLGPFACAAMAGMYWPHIREGRLDKVIVNAASIGFSALAATAAIDVMSVNRDSSVVTVLVLAVPGVVAYWVVNTFVLAFAVSILRGSAFASNAKVLIGSETSMLGFALFGAVAGLMFLKYGYLIGTASITLLLASLDVLVIAPRRWLSSRIGSGVTQRRSLFACLACVFVLAAFGAERMGLLLGAVAAVVGALAVTFLVALLGVHRRVGMWERHLALGIAIVDAPLVVVFTVAGALAAAVSMWVGATIVATALALSVVITHRRQRRLARYDEDDERLAAAVELAVMDDRDWSSSSR